MGWNEVPSVYEKLRNKTVLITGATGLIGQALVNRLLKLDVKIAAVVRSLKKANDLFGAEAPISYIVSDVTELDIKPYDFSYIIHAASNTSSKAFVENPVGVINTAIIGTQKTLEIARLSKVQGYLYLSSMEVYGTPDTDDKISELHSTDLNTMAPRSAYPESKRMCECLCASYASQYGVPAKVVRLAQTFGPGVQYDDGRVFAEFARCVIEERDIVLHTKGETKRNYLYTEDAVDAILTVMLDGNVGEAYNAANEDTYCSVYEMAKLVAKECADRKINVIIEAGNASSFGYAPTLHMNLDTTKLRELGWKPTTVLSEMFWATIDSMRKHK